MPSIKAQPIIMIADATAPLAKDKILAERFKTQMCRNYERKGSCPYENKCMFAHGDADVRTPEMNVRDGLFTEEAIEAFRRAQRLLRKRANQAARQAAALARSAQAAEGITITTTVFATESQRAGRPSFMCTPTTPSVSVSPAALSEHDSSAMSTIGEVDSEVSECDSSDEIPNPIDHPKVNLRPTSEAIPINIAQPCEGEALSPSHSSHGSSRSLGLGGLSASNSQSQQAPRLVFRHNPYGHSPKLMGSSY
eukprot:GILK01010067.1.p1 GENE.GILK01010067.1~~GILK01010067.1.p1  ORF type:complete len:261 (+),score=8.76 GILK01010067.1:30-785(+)